ncbi:tetratricopeptide/SEL1-like repeat protein, partial [Paraclostridium benzoelyticum]|nr:tetratricopeptide/SEL1-like repeat protein [Paraclostridium benzoelyticum]
IIQATNNLAGLLFEEKLYEEAIPLYKKCIDYGFRESIENLGDLYKQIDDTDSAIDYYKQIEDLTSVQVKLGNIYEQLKNFDLAIKYYLKAAENNDLEAIYRLGIIYEELDDYDKAISFYEKAIEKDHLNSRIHLGKILFEKEEYELSKKLFEVPANEDNGYSQHMLGIIYSIYYKDYVSAKYWYEKTREKGCIESIFNLGQLSLKLNEDSEAEKYFKEGSKLGNKKCEYMLASLYYKKSFEAYESLANENYDNSEEVFKKLPKLILNFDQILISPFETIKPNEEEDMYVPKYLLYTDEKIDNLYENELTHMIVDRNLEFNIENITK